MVYLSRKGGDRLGKECLTDRITLFACCAMIYLCLPQFGHNIVILLAAVCLSSLLDYFSSSPALTVLSAAFLAASISVPALAVFLPVLIYETVRTPRRYFLIPAFLSIALFTYDYQLPAVSVLAASALAVVLKHRSSQLLALRTEHTALEDANRKLSLEKEQEHRILLENQDAEISVAKLAERGRIAREIHDSVGHQLSSSILQVGALQAVNKEERLSPGLANLKDTLNEAMNSIRTSVHDLHDDSVDLEPALASLVKNFSFCPLEFTYNLNTEPPPRIRFTLIAIVRESLTNITRHSNASCASIFLREHPSFLQLVIRDNGTDIVCSEENGIGLQNIRERVETLGGVLNINTETGFRIFITIPKGESQS